MYTTNSSSNKDSLISPFPIFILLNSFTCLIPLIRSYRSTLYKYEESGQHCLFLNFSRNALDFSPFSLVLPIGLLYTALTMLRYVLFITDLPKTFNLKCYWISLKPFTASYGMIM